ncbi:MAG: hypothetical protein JNL85_19450 [Rubrivivax sp.]|nr:hypothetical protein [Rubrivivax sp.]
MWARWRALWQRLRNWWARRRALLGGRWQRLEVQASTPRWGWPPWPFSLDPFRKPASLFAHEATWECALYRPAQLSDAEEAPLVVLLHGCGQRAMAFAHAAGFVAAADRGRFRLLCPEQREGANAWRCWNWFMPAAQGGGGELDVVLRGLEAAERQVRCGRVAAAGLSAGGGLAALLAFHHAARFDAVVTVAAPPLLGRANLQDPRQVMKHGLAISPALAALHIERCAPLMILHGAEDDVVAPRCAEQLAEQALHVLKRRGGGPPAGHALENGVEHLDAGGHLVLRRLLLSGLGHAWSGGPGGHPHAVREGPPLTALVLAFLRETGVPMRAG